MVAARDRLSQIKHHVECCVNTALEQHWAGFSNSRHKPWRVPEVAVLHYPWTVPSYPLSGSAYPGRILLW